MLKGSHVLLRPFFDVTTLNVVGICILRHMLSLVAFRLLQAPRSKELEKSGVGRGPSGGRIYGSQALSSLSLSLGGSSAVQGRKVFD